MNQKSSPNYDYMTTVFLRYVYTLVTKFTPCFLGIFGFVYTLLIHQVANLGNQHEFVNIINLKNIFLFFRKTLTKPLIFDIIAVQNIGR